MYLWVKAVLLLLLSEVMDMSYECDKKEVEANKCIEQRIGKSRSFAKYISWFIKNDWQCCQHYYINCVMFSTLSSCQNKTPKEGYETLVKVACFDSIPTMKKCSSHIRQNPIDNCKQYEPSVCDDWSWNGEPSTTPSQSTPPETSSKQSPEQLPEITPGKTPGTPPKTYSGRPPQSISGDSILEPIFILSFVALISIIIVF